MRAPTMLLLAVGALAMASMLTPVVEAEHVPDHEALEREFQLTQNSGDTAVSAARAYVSAGTCSSRFYTRYLGTNDYSWVVTPGYGRCYPHNAFCGWSFVVPSGRRLRIWCPRIRLYRGDYMLIYNRLTSTVSYAVTGYWNYGWYRYPYNSGRIGLYTNSVACNIGYYCRVYSSN